MSAAASVVDPLRTPAVPLTRLVHVELRKSSDTRAGRWLLGVLFLIGVAALALTVAFAPAEDITWAELFRVAQYPINLLLPVVGILLVTSEWTQRGALTTFTLVPGRHRVMLAKAIALVVLLAIAMTVSFVAATAANLSGTGDGSWDLDLATVGELVLFQLAAVLGGFAFGLVLQSSAPAIVLFYVLPIALSVVAEIVRAIRDELSWVDIAEASTPIGEGTADGTEWAKFGVAAAVWVLVPLAIGLWRLTRTEIK